MATVKSCAQHPKYKGIGIPRADCLDCIKYWHSKRLRANTFDNDEMILKYAVESNHSMRAPRLHKLRLDEKSDKDYAQIMFFGDLHYGHPQCLVGKAMEYLDWARANGVYVLLMGDLLECGLTTSIGDSVYMQKLNPQGQMEFVVEMLRPIVASGLVIGIHDGNHEQRITKTTSINVTKIMASLLGIKYLGYACWSLLSVGNQKYSMYSQHGFSGARFKQTKIKALLDQVAWINADILAMGHVHEVAAMPVQAQAVDMRKQVVATNKRLTFLTGSYLGWDDSYAQAAMLPINRIGSPTLKLMSREHDYHGSV